VGHASSSTRAALEGAEDRLDELSRRGVLTLAGVGLIVVATVLDLAFQGLYGVGPLWSLIMLVWCVLISIPELKALGKSVPGASVIPARFTGPISTLLFAVFVAAHAILLVRFALVPLIWVVAAVFICFDQYRKLVAPARGFGRFFDAQKMQHGYGRLMLAGAAVCLVALFFNWQSSSGGSGGGLDYSYDGCATISYEGYCEPGYSYQYNSSSYYYPGFGLTGRGQNLAIFVVLSLVSLLLIASLRPEVPLPSWFRFVPPTLAGLLSLWWLFHWGSSFGTWIFLAGLVAVDYTVVRFFLATKRQATPPLTA
jgi:hypothetical protein